MMIEGVFSVRGLSKDEATPFSPACCVRKIHHDLDDQHHRAHYSYLRRPHGGLRHHKVWGNRVGNLGWADECCVFFSHK